MSQADGISQAALGRALDLSPPAVTKLKRLGMPVHSVEAALEWRRARLNIAKRKPEPTSAGSSVPAPTFAAHASAPPAAASQQSAQPDAAAALEESHDEARTRREIAEANLAELKLAELQKVLVRVGDVKAERDREHAMVREAFLQLESRLLPLLVAASGDATAMAKVLHDGICETLQIVAEAE